MSDKRPVLRRSGPPFVPKGETKEVVPYAFIHLCFKEGCEVWGAFGIGVKLLDNKGGKWACREHREELYRGQSSDESIAEENLSLPAEPTLL